MLIGEHAEYLQQNSLQMKRKEQKFVRFNCTKGGRNFEHEKRKILQNVTRRE